MKKMASRLATSGYSVLVVNPYYRTARSPVLPEGADFNDPATRQKIMSLMGTFTPQTQTADARAFVDYLDAQPSVARDHKMGTTGYCMGGSFTTDRRRRVLPWRPAGHRQCG
jgi:carboxymethylenebutenolidase